MTSPERQSANRRNARRSTGPRTPGGKARSAQNALQHGLARPVDPTTEPLFRPLVQALAGPDPDLAVVRSAETVALAEMDLRRILARETALLSVAERGPPTHASRSAGEVPGPVLEAGAVPSGADGHRVASTLEGLLRLARYERRARSRLRVARRALRQALSCRSVNAAAGP